MREFLEALRRALRSPAFKFFLTIFLIVLLTIPLLLVYALIWERESRAGAVRAEVGQLWGPEQHLMGPFLVVPYTVRIQTVQGDKRFEQVHVPGRAEPVEIPRQSEALFMLQRLRDEAHRFANTFHRELRGKRMTTSALDGVSGLGPTRQKRLLAELGGVAGVKRASLDDLRALRWLPDPVADALHAKLHA